jgi:hypothetical protein
MSALKSRKFWAAAILVVLLGITGVTVGMQRDEVSHVVKNAKLLCFSCIGIK